MRGSCNPWPLPWLAERRGLSSGAEGFEFGEGFEGALESEVSALRSRVIFLLFGWNVRLKLREGSRMGGDGPRIICCPYDIVGGEKKGGGGSSSNCEKRGWKFNHNLPGLLCVLLCPACVLNIRAPGIKLSERLLITPIPPALYREVASRPSGRGSLFDSTRPARGGWKGDEVATGEKSKGAPFFLHEGAQFIKLGGKQNLETGTYWRFSPKPGPTYIRRCRVRVIEMRDGMGAVMILGHIRKEKLMAYSMNSARAHADLSLGIEFFFRRDRRRVYPD